MFFASFSKTVRDFNLKFSSHYSNKNFTSEGSWFYLDPLFLEKKLQKHDRTYFERICIYGVITQLRIPHFDLSTFSIFSKQVNRALVNWYRGYDRQ